MGVVVGTKIGLDGPISLGFALAAVLEAGVLALVAVLVVIIAVLLGNRLHRKLSCHIDNFSIKWRKREVGGWRENPGDKRGDL